MSPPNPVLDDDDIRLLNMMSVGRDFSSKALAVQLGSPFRNVLRMRPQLDVVGERLVELGLAIKLVDEQNPGSPRWRATLQGNDLLETLSQAGRGARCRWSHGRVYRPAEARPRLEGAVLGADTEGSRITVWMQAYGFAGPIGLVVELIGTTSSPVLRGEREIVPSDPFLCSYRFGT